jgi:hypothetical protein
MSFDFPYVFFGKCQKEIPCRQTKGDGGASSTKEGEAGEAQLARDLIVPAPLRHLSTGFAQRKEAKKGARCCPHIPKVGT